MEEIKNKSIDFAIYETKEKLIKLINSSGLPVGVSIMLLREILDLAEIKYNQIIEEELNNRQLQESK